VLDALGVDVGGAVLLGRVGQAGLVEQVEVDVHEGREDREGQADLALFLDAVEVDQGRVEVGEVVVVLLDVRGEVEPGAGEGGAAADAHGADDVGGVAGGDLGGEDVRGLVGVDDLQDEFDVVLARVELLDDQFLGGDGRGVRARAHADEPADLDLVGGAGTAPVEAGGGGEECGGADGGGLGGRTASGAEGRCDPHVEAPCCGRRGTPEAGRDYGREVGWTSRSTTYC
jgi:hypothetical protein